MRPPLIAFDVGGTWFRSATVSDDLDVREVRRTPAVSVHTGASPQEAKGRILEYLTTEVSRRRGSADGAMAGISLGAAYNARAEVALGSGPLWGADEEPFDVLSQLRERSPTTEWYITNDVTAMALRAAMLPRLRSQTFALITLSSGIGARLVLQPGATIPLDAIYGIQGEVGHLPVTVWIGDRPLSARCDCGGADHLASFISGRGLATCLEHPIVSAWIGPREATWNGLGRSERMSVFVSALTREAPWATELLAGLSAPLADLLSVWITCEPRITAFALTGGLFEAIGPVLTRCLIRRSRMHGPYIVARADPSWLARRLVACPCDDLGGIVGAAIFALRRRAGDKVYD